MADTIHGERLQIRELRSNGKQVIIDNFRIDVCQIQIAVSVLARLITARDAGNFAKPKCQ